MVSVKRLRSAFSKKLKEAFEKRSATPNTISIQQEELMTKIDSKRIDAIEKAVLTLAVGVQKLIDEAKKSQELMVHVATLHEELLHQLDQGNVALVRVQQNEPDMDDDFDVMLQDYSESTKKKTEFN